MGKTVPNSQVHSTKDDILRYLLRAEQATAHELATALEVSPQAIRRHLKDLELEQLVIHQPVQAGMGRPQHRYRLSHQGRQRFPVAYDQFAVSLLDTLAETVPPDQFGHILRRQWIRKSEAYREAIGHGSLPERLDKFVEIRRSEGYMSEWYLLTDQDSGASLPSQPQPYAEGSGNLGKQYVISEYNCSIPSVAESFPQICNYELELFTAIFSDCHVKRTHWLINGEHRCGYLVQVL